MKKNKKEPNTKLKKILLIILVLLFVINTVLVIADQTVVVDGFIHKFAFSFRCTILDKTLKIWTKFGGTLLITIISVISVLFLYFKGQKKLAVYEAATILSSTIINNLVKVIVCRPRPTYLRLHESTWSYPSGHTMASVTLYGFAIYCIYRSNLNKGLKILFITLLSILMLGILFSRLYFGVHYFSDIVGGILLSLSILLTVSIINDNREDF